ncbi:hypothetical protein P4H42_28130 [Paenibacillus macerans]|nr:hypothetical protein [Paenibacillus macerans]MEC0333437.1 hypothetical protein [Paenibacillus macerans]
MNRKSAKIAKKHRRWRGLCPRKLLLPLYQRFVFSPAEIYNSTFGEQKSALVLELKVFKELRYSDGRGVWLNLYNPCLPVKSKTDRGKNHGSALKA